MRRMSSVSIVGMILFSGPLMGAPPDPSGGTGGPPLAGSLTVRVIAAETGNPIAGAFVMVGGSPDDPLMEVGFTAASGEVTFAHAALAGPATVTAGASGRGYVTLFDLGVSEVVVPLASLAPPPTARIGDRFDGIEVNNGVFCIGDGNLDLGFVIPAVAPADALAGGAALELSTTLEPMSTPQGPVLLPSNVVVPRQCEALGYYEKPTYHLRVATGRRTLFGLSARIGLLAFLNAQSIVDLIRATSFRELDILRDVPISADGDEHDLFADLALANNLTLQISNGQPATAVIAAAGGRITASDGSEEVILTGLGAFDPDQDGPAATLTVATRAATGELPDLVHAAFVTQLRDVATVGNGRGSTTALLRSGFTPPATRGFSSFYGIVEVDSADDTTFSWSDVSSATSPPARHLNTSRLVYRRQAANPDDPAATVTESVAYWTFYAPGSRASLTIPTLAPSAPVALPVPDATAVQDRLDFTQAVQFLGDDPDGFSFDAFAFADAGRYGTHVSSNDRPLRCATVSEISGLMLSKGPGPGEVTLGWSSSPDMCHDTLSGVGYEVYRGDRARPTVPPGSWPSDPFFTRITVEDLDGSTRNASFTHVPPDGLVLYLVVDRGLDGGEGASGHYGSHAP